MYRFLATLCFFLIIFFFDNQQSFGSEISVAIPASNINIREGPGLEYETIIKGYKGEIYPISKQEGEWIQVTLSDGQVGWIAKYLVTIEERETKDISKSAIIIADGLRVREGPGSHHKVVGVLYKGERVVVMESMGTWLYINASFGEGWIPSKFIGFNSATQEVERPIRKDEQLTVLFNGTNLRSGPNAGTEIVGSANAGATFTSSGQEGDWFKISLGDGLYAFIASWLVSTDQSVPEKTSSPFSLKDKAIIIDPGHGGRDKGTTGSKGTLEKKLNLSTAQKLYEKLKKAGANVVLTRSTDSYVPLESRVSISQSHYADAFISIHYDSILDRSISGITSYYHHSSQQTLATSIHKAIIDKTNLTDRGTRFGDYHVLRENTRNAVLLELGYLSNPTEEELINTEQYQERVTSGILQGLERYFEGH